MLFQTVSFLLFCVITFAAYWRLRPGRIGVLAIANGLFYLVAGWPNLVLFVAASYATYRIGRHVAGVRGKPLLVLGIVLNLCNLCFFKYAAFLGSTISPWLAWPWLAPAFLHQILLPIGISFYTFQNVSYLVDRRTKELAAAPSYLHYWVYIAFFGHSIAGPIMRGHEFLPQVERASASRFDGAQFQYGLYLFLLGLLKKVVVADALAPTVNHFFGRAATLNFGEAWTAALLFGFQIYFDFSAYSDMAVGIGKFFGFELSVNFRTPYLAANGGEFWSRWHITLSQWIRDYVYIPLGGNQCHSGRQQLNLMLAMLASGLWHGAAWTYVFWGGYHGLLLIGQRQLGQLKTALGWRFFQSRAYHVCAVASFFMLSTGGWVLFRAQSLDDAINMGAAMANVGALTTAWAERGWLFLAAGLFFLHWAEFQLRRDEQGLAQRCRELPVVVQGLAYASLILLVMLSVHGANDFIYFKF